MESLFLLIPMAVVLVIGIAALFFWAVRSGQFDDLEGPAHRILWDDEPQKKQTEEDTADEEPRPKD